MALGSPFSRARTQRSTPRWPPSTSAASAPPVLSNPASSNPSLTPSGACSAPRAG